MADLPISQLTAQTGPLNLNSMLAISIGGSNFRCTVAQLIAAFNLDVDPVVSVTLSGNTLTVQNTSGTETYTISNSGGGSSLPSLRISSTSSEFLHQLNEVTSLTNSMEMLISNGTSSSFKSTLETLKTWILSGVSGGGSSSSILESNGSKVIYSGSSPTVTKVAGATTINVPANTIILSVETKITSPADQNGTNSNYSISVNYPTDTMQTLAYDGSIDQCSIPSTSIYTLGSNSATFDYPDTVIQANPNGLTCFFPEAFPASSPSGVRRSLMLSF